MTVERSLRIINENGLHARPAAEIARVASKFKSEITLTKDGVAVNAKSVMGVMLLAAECGSTIVVRASGDDCEQALAALENVFINRFGELA